MAAIPGRIWLIPIIFLAVYLFAHRNDTPESEKATEQAEQRKRNVPPSELDPEIVGAQIAPDADIYRTGRDMARS